MTKQQNSQELLATVKNEVTGKITLNIDALPADLKSQVVDLGTQIQSTISELGKSALQLASLFTKAQELLEGKGYFVAFINSIPGFSQMTVYRMIKRFKLAKEKAFKSSPHVLQLAMATGTDIAGTDEEKPFGKFTDAVKKVGPPPKLKGNAVTKQDRVAAEMWLNEVKSQQEKDWHKKTRGTKSPEDLQKSAVNGFMNAYNKVEPTQQMGFIRTVMGYILFKVGVPGMTINPKQPGKTIEGKLTDKKEPKKEKEEKPKGKAAKASD